MGNTEKHIIRTLAVALVEIPVPAHLTFVRTRSILFVHVPKSSGVFLALLDASPSPCFESFGLCSCVVLGFGVALPLCVFVVFFSFAKFGPGRQSVPFTLSGPSPVLGRLRPWPTWLPFAECSTTAAAAAGARCSGSKAVFCTGRRSTRLATNPLRLNGFPNEHVARHVKTTRTSVKRADYFGGRRRQTKTRTCVRTGHVATTHRSVSQNNFES